MRKRRLHPDVVAKIDGTVSYGQLKKHWFQSRRKISERTYLNVRQGVPIGNTSFAYLCEALNRCLDWRHTLHEYCHLDDRSEYPTVDEVRQVPGFPESTTDSREEHHVLASIVSVNRTQAFKLRGAVTIKINRRRNISREISTPINEPQTTNTQSSHAIDEPKHASPKAADGVLGDGDTVTSHVTFCQTDKPQRLGRHFAIARTPKNKVSYRVTVATDHIYVDNLERTPPSRPAIRSLRMILLASAVVAVALGTAIWQMSKLGHIAQINLPRLPSVSKKFDLELVPIDLQDAVDNLLMQDLLARFIAPTGDGEFTADELSRLRALHGKKDIMSGLQFFGTELSSDILPDYQGQLTIQMHRPPKGEWLWYVSTLQGIQRLDVALSANEIVTPLGGVNQLILVVVPSGAHSNLTPLLRVSAQ